MSKIFEIVIKKGRPLLKKEATNFVGQGIESIKYSANEKLNTVVNQSVQNISSKTQSFFSGTSEESLTEISSVSDSEYQDDAYQDGDAFEENLHGNLKGMVSSLAAGDPAEAREVLNNLVTMAGEVQKFTEVQKTKRKEIEAKRDVIVKNIESQKEIILAYLEKSFDERKDNFSKLFSIVDNAIVNNNMQQLALGLDSINKLADSSPFKALASIESTKLALEDKNKEGDF
jgi:hypothetical protein